jgi:hypothetical protein
LEQTGVVGAALRDATPSAGGARGAVGGRVRAGGGARTGRYRLGRGRRHAGRLSDATLPADARASPGAGIGPQGCAVRGIDAAVDPAAAMATVARVMGTGPDVCTGPPGRADGRGAPGRGGAAAVLCLGGDPLPAAGPPARATVAHRLSGGRGYHRDVGAIPPPKPAGRAGFQWVVAADSSQARAARVPRP